MKNKLLITTALVALSVAANAYAADITVDAGETNYTIPTDGTSADNIIITGETSKLNLTGDWQGWGTPGTEFETANINVNGGELNLTNSRVVVVKDNQNGTMSFENAKLNLDKSSLDLSSGDNGYNAEATFKNSIITLTDSEMPVDGNVNFEGGNFDLSFGNTTDSDYQVEVYNLNLEGTTVTVDDQREITTDHDSSLAAKNKLNITNGSDVTLKGKSVLAWNGQVYDENDQVVAINGEVNIKDSTLKLQDEAILRIGSDDDEGADSNQARLSISHSEITADGSSSIEFYSKNKEQTTISDNSTITLNSQSSMKLNNLKLSDSEILLKDNATLEVADVELSDASIKGNGNNVKFTGDVLFGGFFDPAVADVDGNLTRNGYDDEITYNLNSGTLKYEDDKHLYDSAKHGGEYSLNSINLKGGTLDIANGKVSEIKLAKLNLAADSNIALDADLANKTIDRFSDDTLIEGTAKLNISKLNLVSDAVEEETKINFTEKAELLAATNYTGANSGLRALSPIYSYDVAYDTDNGNFTFIRGSGNSASDYNPSVYAPSVIGHTVDFLQYNIANAAFNSLAASQPVRRNGMSSGDMPEKANVWASVIGFDDSVDFDGFQSVDSNMMSVIGGVNSDVHYTPFGRTTYGIYAGYMNGESEYDGNEIDQKGGYVGLSTRVERSNAFAQGAINGGFIQNEDKHSFGTDKFDSYWGGVALKGGLDYNAGNGITVQPNVYAGYTFVNTEDYTSKSGAKIKNDDLHLFEVAPGLKISKDFQNGWNTFAQAKYAFVMDNGGEVDIEDVSLPNISADDYVEYGVGVDKKLGDSWDMSVSANRRDGGREGWNGNISFKYNF